MKIISWIVGLFLSLFALVYVVGFTSFGNSMLKPTIESKIQNVTKLDSKLKTFSVSMSYIDIVLELNHNNVITVRGDYSLFSKSFDLEYGVNLEELKTLKPLTGTQLQSSFHTDGKVIGDMALLNIDGKSDVAKSITQYHVELKEFNPTSIIAKIDAADLESLLYMLNQKEYASADINLDVNFKNITPHQLDGDIVLQTLHGKLNANVMKKDFNITIPKSAFSMNLDAKLIGDAVDYNYILNSNLAKITSNGNVVPQPLKVDAQYGVNIKELAVLKPITGADLRGPFKLDGHVKGNQSEMTIDGLSDIAQSETTFTALLKEFTPASVKAKIRHLKLQNVLYMVNQPHFTDGLLDLDADIADANIKSLQGVITSKITKGVVDTSYMTKAYKFKSKMPYTAFDATTHTKIANNVVDTKVDFNSNLANLDVKSAKFNIKDSSIISDYLVNVKNLKKLYFVTQRNLKGGLVANGEFKQAKDLDFTMHSNVAGGKVDAKLHNDDFHADLASLKTLDILDILVYPKVIQSVLNGTLDYNLVSESGVLDAKLSDGYFTKNQVLDLTKQYARIDLYKQKFKGDMDAKILKEHINASLNLKSNTSSIVTKNTTLNSKTQQINSKIAINANGNPIVVTLKGNSAAPKVGIDAKKILQKEAQKAIGKKVNNLFKGLF